jgi:drug/metabolite transporter (DMT)-like permease
MGLLDNQSESPKPDNSKSAEEVLNTVTQNLKALQQDLVAQLSRDVERLQSEKSRLVNEIDKLRDQREMLQSQQQHLLSQQQLAQQQVWAKQLAQAMAAHLQALLIQRLNQQIEMPPAAGSASLPSATDENGYAPNAYQLLSSLDTTLNYTLNSLRQDLNSYQSSLSQQINRMQTLEQQGEAILEALVNRLSQRLQQDLAANRSPRRSPPRNGNRPVMPPIDQPPTLPPSGRSPAGDLPRPTPSVSSYPSQPGYRSPNGAPKVLATAPAIAPEALTTPIKPTRPVGLSQFQLGLMMILISTMALSLHNVVVGIIYYPSNIFGELKLGGFITPNFGNSLLVLWTRMLIVVPMMLTLASFLYPSAWKDIKAFSLSRDRPLLFTVIGSGFFLFLSQVLIYIAIGQIGPGVAVTILFMYPIITVPLAWVLFGDRPTLLRFWVMLTILAGVILTAVPKLSASASSGANVALGVTTAVISGFAFAFYLISMQISFRKLHPVPVSMIQFTAIFVLTSLSLITLGPRLGVDIPVESRLGFWVGGSILATLTLLGYLTNNFGVRFMGAAMASIIASSGPVLTALLAFLITPSKYTLLLPIQVLGILVVTLGVIALSVEKMIMQKKAAAKVAKAAKL